MMMKNMRASIPMIVAAGLIPEYSPEHPCGRVERHADVYHDRRDDRYDGEPVAALPVVAALQVVGERGHTRAEIQGAKRSERSTSANPAIHSKFP